MSLTGFFPSRIRLLPNLNVGQSSCPNKGPSSGIAMTKDSGFWLLSVHQLCRHNSEQNEALTSEVRNTQF